MTCPRRCCCRAGRVIYSGVFGRGLFQTLYEPPSTLSASLPLTFEWSAAALALAAGGLAARGWWWLLAVPLLATVVMCVDGARKAPIDKRFTGLKARALVALLIYLGPLLRGWERIKWRLRETRAQSRIGVPESPQRARIAWAERALHLAYWSEQAAEKEVLLGALIDFLLPHKYVVAIDSGWSGWDLKIARGLYSRALILVCVENHGGAKRLLRVRCKMRFSHFALFLLRGCATGTAAALILGWPAAAVAAATAGLTAFAAMSRQLLGFARLMHRIIEAVARQSRLVAVEPEPPRRA